MEQSYGRLIQRAREKAGLSQRRLSVLAGHSLSWLSRIERGLAKPPSIEDLERIAEICGVSLAEVGLTGRMHDEVLAQADLGRRVRELIGTYDVAVVQRVGMMDVAVAGVVPANRVEDVQTQLQGVVHVPEELLSGVREPAAFLVSGDCLRDEGIVDGDYLIVDQARKTPRPGEIVVALVNGELTAKVFYQQGVKIELRPAGPGYETIRVDGSDEVEIVGTFVALHAVGRRGRQ